jgi:hypothetical protein
MGLDFREDEGLLLGLFFRDDFGVLLLGVFPTELHADFDVTIKKFELSFGDLQLTLVLLAEFVLQGQQVQSEEVLCITELLVELLNLQLVFLLSHLCRLLFLCAFLFRLCV